tara:strand:+ start:111 stop:920 length:810 start_codon:yes stop_codon:yes gene_type:complete
MDIDLNEDNYNYEKLLNLFSLPPQFTKEDLKRAKKKVLQLHPDKSNLPNDYFLFFKKMYYKIEEIYNYTTHSTSETELNKSIDIETHFKDYLEKRGINPKTNFKEFSKEFNKMFDSIYVKDGSETGYGDWLKSEDGMYNANDVEESRKQMLQTQITKRQTIEEVGTHDKSKLYAYDIKQAWSTPIIAMDVEKVYAEKPKFNSVHEFKQQLARDDQEEIMGRSQGERFLKEKEDILNNQAKEMAYQQMKQSDKHTKNYELYISKYLTLEG